MFAKKLLSIVSVLFIGSHLISRVNAIALPSCPAEISNDCDVAATLDADSIYCIESNVIYKYKTGENAGARRAVGACTTKEQVAAGLYVFNIDTAKPADLTVSIDTVKANIALYNCNASKCVMTSGVVSDNAENYIVAAAGGADDTTATTFEKTTSCDVGEIRTDSSNSLCVTDAILSTSGKSYLMENVAGNLFGTEASGTDKSIAIKAASKVIAFDNLLTDDVCISDGKEINSRIDGFCNANACTSQVTCTNGVCEALAHSCTREVTQPTACNPKTAAGECEAGYYILAKGGDTFLTAAGEGDLYHCTVKGSCGEGAVDAAQYPTGYLVNADPTAANTAVVPYIQCTKGGKCLGLDKTTITAADCSDNAVKAGNLILVGGTTPKLCITNGKDVAIANNDKYFICYEEDNNNAFTGKIPDGFCGIVEMTATDITLKNRVGSTSTKYIYTNANQKIYTEKHDDICKSTGTITEFKLDYCSDKEATDVTDYYIKGATTPGPIAA